MLLGIALHAALAYTGLGWIVSDDRTSPALALLVPATHGFRMPLFFLLSGFFTAMLWKQRGLKGMLSNRGKHILLPLLLSCITILPAMLGSILWAISHQAQSAQLPTTTNIWSAAATGDIGLVRTLGQDEALLNAQDATYGVTPLGWAAVTGKTEAAKTLLELGADPNALYRDHNAPLLTACFFGRTELARILIDHGANPSLADPSGERMRGSMRADRQTTEFIAGLVKVAINFDDVRAGRDQIATFLKADALAPSGTAKARTLPPWLRKLMVEPFFHHLWFLWFLWWLVGGFAIVVLLVQRLPTIPLPARLFSLPWCLLWLVPITMLPQALMHQRGQSPGFGPDTSAGLIPMPHVLLYYAIFFGYGALAHASRGFYAKVGARWYITLPLGLIVLPIGLRLGGEHAESIIANPTARHAASAASQAAYALLMTFGVIGLFETFASKHRSWVRYVSDSSYWLYLVHLPLVIVGQALLIALPLPAAAKFSLLTLSVTATLLLCYQLLVRHTRLGLLLGGKRCA